MTYPILRDISGDVYSAYKIQGLTPFPLDAIVDQNGIVQYLQTEYDPQFMLEVLLPLLNTTGIDERPDISNTAKAFDLKIGPNPTNSSTVVEFVVPDRSDNIMTVYNVTGQVVFERNLGYYAIGEKVSVALDLKNQVSGIYLLRMQNGSYQSVQRLILAK